MENMKDKVAVITGATSGIGREVALLFSKHQIKVVLAGRNEKAGNSLVDEITKKGHEAVFVKTDVKDEKSVQSLINIAKKHYGKIDYAINNAGIEGVFKPLVEITEDEWNEIMNTNLKGVWLCLKYELIEMQKQGGVIVNTSTNLTRLTLSNSGPYSTSKAGVDALTKIAAIEYGKYNIRVNAINPGAVDTPMLQRILDLDQIGEMKKANPMNKIATTKDIAETVLWLCSSMASHINGENIYIDGGASLL